MTATLCGPGGVRAVIAENLLLKQQLIVVRRPRQRAPRLTASDRLLFGFESLFLSPGRIRKVAIGVRPSTLLAFHQALVRRTYRRLCSSSACPKQPGPKGPSEALIQAIVELTSRNPRFGCPRIARIIARTFGANIDKNVVYRVLSTHYRPIPGGTGPSWVSFIGHTTDSLWSVDLFRCAPWPDARRRDDRLGRTQTSRTCRDSQAQPTVPGGHPRYPESHKLLSAPGVPGLPGVFAGVARRPMAATRRRPWQPTQAHGASSSRQGRALLHEYPVGVGSRVVGRLWP